jgi:hypothetical protein
MNAFFKEYGVLPEEIMLTSGPVKVSKFSWLFRSWAGTPLDDTYGRKAVLDSEGIPVFAELALIPVLKQHGSSGAVWVDSYHRCFRDAMPPAVCKPPDQIHEVYERIATINGGRRGCWDVLAWNGDGVTFVECKRKRKDRMTSNEVKWLESALKAGLRLENFSICEWKIES